MNETPEPQHLVVVGSSAGGIEALSILLGALSEDFPAPVVLAQHLDPNRPSQLATILERKTALPIVVVGDDTPLENGKVYVVPSNQHVVIRDGHVALEPHHSDRPRPSVDLLLSSAARAYGDRLIAVVLTGSGSDGASGAVEVKDSGGVVVIQNPETAAHPSMPLALPPTAVDHVADIEQMGPLLHDLLTGASLPEKVAVREDVMTDILGRISRQAFINFGEYKPSTLLRRIGRRMAIHHVPTLEEYRDYLAAHPEEIAEVVMSLLIKVTEFFRDPEAFQFMKEKVLPKLIETGRTRGRHLRLWSAGCATGEEAYSLAILVSEALGSELPEWNVRIFATDVDAATILYARRGLFTPAAVKTVPGALRNRYFEPVDHGFRINKGLRQMVIFGQQDLSRGVPFPRIDMVVCRNLLIYFKPELQQEVLDLFAYSLHPTGGYLFLGKAETARPSKSVFEVTNKKWRVYRCLSGPPPVPIRGVSSLDRSGVELSTGERGALAETVPEFDLGQLRRVNEVLLRFLPYGVALIDRSYRILSMNNAARRVLGLRESGIGQDFLHAARSLPYPDIRAAIDRMFREQAVVTLGEIALESPGPAAAHVSVVVSPVQFDGMAGPIGMVCVQDTSEFVEMRRSLTEVRGEQKRLSHDLSANNLRLTEMNQELQDANEELQAGNEEMMLAQEELQATNEEFEATNEELQATNEELETNNEELQATNEELETTNEELQARTTELQDLAKVLTGERQRLSEMVDRAPFSTMLLRGPALVIENANANASLEPLFGDLRTIGTPLDEALTGPEFEVVRNGVRQAFLEDRTWTSGRTTFGERPDQRTYRFSAVPSHDAAGRPDGAVLYSEDLTEVVRHEEKEHLDRLKLMLDHADQVAMAVFDAHSSQLLYASRRYVEMLKRALNPEGGAFEGHSWKELWFGDAEGLEAFAQVVASGRPQRFREVRGRRGPQGSVWDISLIPIADEDEKPGVQHVVVSATEVTESVLNREHLERLDRMKDEFLSLASHELRTPLAPLAAYTEVLSKMLDDPRRGESWETQIRAIINGFRRQVQLMSRLTDDLLDMSRLQTGKFTLDLKPVEVRRVVEDSVERASMTSSRPPIRLEFRLEPGARVMGDEVRIAQMVQNLLSNALRHAPESEWVDLRVHPVHRDGTERIRLEVQDYGPGVPAAGRKSLFTRFFQSTDGSNHGKNRGGLGLGLYIARQIAEQHGGRIGVEFNEPGTTFWVELPRLEA